MDPGFRLRQSRERLGLTYRDVERASIALARVHTRPQFTVHISRLAEIENGGVVPSLHKLYALAVVYHLNPLEILGWYDIPLDRFLGDAISFTAPQTHLVACPDFSGETCDAVFAGVHGVLGPLRCGVHKSPKHSEQRKWSSSSLRVHRIARPAHGTDSAARQRGSCRCVCATLTGK
jgi:transcriptional regulator with XRE-family HTH domain